MAKLLKSARFPVFGLLTLLIGPFCNGDDNSSYVPVETVPYQVESEGEFDPQADPDATTGGVYTTWAGPSPKSLNVWIDNWAFSGLIMSHLFESLVELHSTEDKPVGRLAARWTSAPDGKTFTFYIREHATWSDGTPVTAHDIVFYYDTIMNEEHLTAPTRARLQRFERPEVIDEKTVRIIAKEPHWNAFWDAADFTAFPKHIWEGQDFNKINSEFPVVSGPYELLEYKRNRYVMLRRRGDWWGRSLKYYQYKYNFDYLRFRFNENRDTALQEFVRGDYDAYSVYTSSIWVDKTPTLKPVEEGWVVRQSIYNDQPRGFQGLALNLRQPRFQDVRVRKALQLLLDRETMNRQLMSDEYYLLNTYFPSIYPGGQSPSLGLRNYDPDQAALLLDEAGWVVGDDGYRYKNGQRFVLSYITHASDNRHMQLYQQDLDDAGIELKIETLSKAEVTKRTDDFNFDIFWINTGASRIFDVEGLFHSRFADQPGTSNMPGIKDDEVDSLLDQLRGERNLTARKELLRRLDRRLHELSPYLLLWQSNKTRLLYWNRFGRPDDMLGRYYNEDAIGLYWWFDQDKRSELEAAIESETKLTHDEPDEVFYGDRGR